MNKPAGHQDGRKIRELRKKHGLSVRELASQVGVHPQSLRRVELGYGSAGIGLLVKLAAALDVDLPEIVRSAEENGNGVAGGAA